MNNQGIHTTDDKSNKSATKVQQELPVMGKRIEVTKENVYYKSSTNCYTYMKTFVQYTGT